MELRLAALLDHIQKERDFNEGWISLHMRDGHPAAAERRRAVVAERDEWIAALRAVAAPWVRCSERLPDRPNAVLVVDGGVTRIGYFEDGWFYGSEPLTHVTHWTPLPAKPSPQEIGEEARKQWPEWVHDIGEEDES